MDALISKFEKAPYTGVLYHYTSLEALTKIVESRVLHASEAHFLNDSAEVIHLSGMVRQVLHEMNSDTIIEQLQDWLLIRKWEKPLVFVGSFSEAGNLLSQWRSYCPQWQGVSIGFAARNIKALATNQGFTLVKCIYDPAEHRALASDIANAFIEHARTIGPAPPTQAHPTQSYHPSFAELENAFVRLCCVAKHNTFAEEREWRVISNCHPNYVEPEISYRPGKSALIPHLKFVLPQAQNKVSFENVILGPTPNERISFRSMHMYLARTADCRTTACCGIPYRDY